MAVMFMRVSFLFLARAVKMPVPISLFLLNSSGSSIPHLKEGITKLFTIPLLILGAQMIRLADLVNLG